MRLKIDEICDLNKSSLTSKDVLDSIDYLDTSSITENMIFGVQKLKYEDAPSRAKRKVSDNTIVYSTVRPNLKHFGILNNPKNNFIVSTGFATIDIKKEYQDKINPYYVYLLLSNQVIVDHLAQKAEVAVSSYPSINPSDIGDLVFDIPDKVIQDKIVSQINPIDHKIALNTRLNAELEAMAKQLYDYWFVQFDFPNEEGKPYKSSGGKMVWNEKLKREIPEGWEVKRIGDYARIFTGKKDVSNAVPGEYLFFSCAPEPITSNEFIYDGEAVLVSGNGSYTGRVTYYKGKFDLYQRTYACVLKDQFKELYPWFYCYMKYYFQPLYSGGKHGSAIPYIVFSDLSDSVIVAKEGVMADFSKIMNSTLNEFYINYYWVNNHLTRLRDSLLPMLMNGQVTME